jgi:predicted alpha/beta-hydrolase family hydrolase
LSTLSISIGTGASRTTGLIYRAAHPRGATLILAHGAGAPQSHPWIVRVAEALAERDVDVVTFNFLYAAATRRAPDKNAVLEETWRAAIRAVRARSDIFPEPPVGRLFVGGKSMGGRIASQVCAADGVAVDGLVLLGYPLHPPGKPHELRVAHLSSVRCPMLFVQGARDAFGTEEELGPIVSGLPGARLVVVPGGDHSFAVPKRTRETPDTVLARVADEVARFIASR